MISLTVSSFGSFSVDIDTSSTLFTKATRFSLGQCRIHFSSEPHSLHVILFLSRPIGLFLLNFRTLLFTPHRRPALLGVSCSEAYIFEFKILEEQKMGDGVIKLVEGKPNFLLFRFSCRFCL